MDYLQKISVEESFTYCFIIKIFLDVSDLPDNPVMKRFNLTFQNVISIQLGAHFTHSRYVVLLRHEICDVFVEGDHLCILRPHDDIFCTQLCHVSRRSLKDVFFII